MAYTSIDDPAQYFNTVIYTGDGGSNRSVTVDFQPDWVWIKERNGTNDQTLFDSVRGATKRLRANATEAEDTQANQLKSFDSDGFTLGSLSAVNSNGQNYVSWNWLAGGSASSNSDGSITSSVSASTTSGFSIVSWTGTGSTATLGHGLGVTPQMIIVKKRDTSGTDWITFGSVLGGTVGSEFIKLNFVNAKTTGLNTSWFNQTAPTSSVFTVGTQSDLNGSSATYIAYCFVEKKGYSKIGSFIGNGDNDGPFVYTGFRPAWIISKRTDNSSGGEWNILDNKRDTFNVADAKLEANNSDAEESDEMYDILSNGFKITKGDGNINASGGTYIFMAFAESPFVNSNGVPTNAR
tara:strand:+ start:1789 stop:2841 length:1053 start_codon:yes stop_codon:yes gene_type:complete